MPHRHADYLELKYFRGLDGLRALAAFMVIAYHMEDDFLLWIDGASGVQIFFVLSGFLITALLLKEEFHHKGISLKAFYIRRAFRIFPAYYFVLAVYCVLIFAVPFEQFGVKREELARDIPYFLTYLNEYRSSLGNGAGFGHSWSLAIEEKFYLIWPVAGFLMLGYVHRKHRATLVVGLVVLLLTVKILFRPGNGFVCYYFLAIGCLLAVLLDQKKYYGKFESLIRNPIGPWAILAAFAIVHLLKRDSELLLLIYPLTVAFLIALAVIGNGRTANVLECAPLKYLGRISYGIYLVHVLATNLVQHFIQPGSDNAFVVTGIFVLSVGLSAGLASLIYFFIEKPLINYGRMLARRKNLNQALPESA